MKIIAYMRILRPILYPTAVADAFLGAGCAALAIGSIMAPIQLLNAALVSVLLYAGGMVHNDIADVEIDRKEGKSRPIVDGDISLRGAYVLFVSLWIFAGAVLVFMPVSAIIVAAVCCLFILFYNLTHKKLKILSPFIIGICRALSVLIAVMAVSDDVLAIYANPVIFTIIIAYSLYVVAVTFISLLEESPGDKGYLFSAIAAITTSIVAVFPLLSEQSLKHWFFLFVVVAMFFLMTLVSVLSSVKRRKKLGQYIPVWLSPLTLLGGLGLIFFTIGDPVSKFVVPSILLASCFPLLFGVFYYRAEKGNADNLDSQE